MTTLVESLLDGLPIEEMATLVRTDTATIRDASRGAILNAVQHGVAPEEAARRIGVTMWAALAHTARAATP